MKKFKGVVVQRCYINVEVEVEDDADLDQIAYDMQVSADPVNGSWESEALDIEEIKGE